MDKTPLQLYQQAYTLHYTEKQLEKAAELYNFIIQQFPNTDASGYASIQVAKITSQSLKPLAPPHSRLSQKIDTELENRTTVEKKYEFENEKEDYEKIPKKLFSEKHLDEDPVSRKGTGALTLFSILMFLIVFGVLAAGYVFYTKKTEDTSRQLAYNSLAIRVLSKIALARETEALTLLTEMKTLRKEDITAYSISADIYVKNNDFVRAKKEWSDYSQIIPNNRYSSSEVNSIEIAEKAYVQKQNEIKQLKEEQTSDTVQKKPLPKKQSAKKMKTKELKSIAKH